MPTSWVCYWHQYKCVLAQEEGAVGKPLHYLFGGAGQHEASARRSKVKPGDLVYVTSMRDGKLLLLSRFTVHRLALLADWVKGADLSPEAQALYALAGADPKEILAAWVEKHHAQHLVWGGSSDVAEGVGTPLRFDVAVPGEYLSQIRFLARKTGQEMPLGAVEDGRLKAASSLQNMYRVLSPQTAELFERVLANAPPADEVAPPATHRVQ